MKRRLLALSCAALASLPGCSKEPAQSGASSAPSEESTAAVSDASSEVDLQPYNASATEAANAGLTEIPGVIRGRWGLVAADCTSKRGDAKGLLEITADQLKFYEAVARLGEVKEEGEGRIRATFDYSGEGQSWTQDVVLDVQQDGKTLIKRDYGKDTVPGPLKYTRCT